jgi:uncharacterized protein with HEPN domain
MSRARQRLIDYMAHMLQAIERIERYVEPFDKAAFLQNELVQDAVMRNFEILGEASNNIQRHYPQFLVQRRELPLAAASQMRNAIAHGYFMVDLEIVWETIHTDLPTLFKDIQHILDEEEGGEP